MKRLNSQRAVAVKYHMSEHKQLSDAFACVC